MTAKVNLKDLTETLNQQRDTLVKRLEGAADSDSNGQPFNPDRTDLTSTYQEHQRNKLFLARTEDQLKAIDVALASIKEGTYGICQHCGNQIATGRLAVMPTVTRCITCQQRKNK